MISGNTTLDFRQVLLKSLVPPSLCRSAATLYTLNPKPHQPGYVAHLLQHLHVQRDWLVLLNLPGHAQEHWLQARGRGGKEGSMGRR